MGDVQGEKWYSRWIAACTASLENVFSWGPEHVICVGIQADTGVNPATEAEFPALQRHIQLGFKEKRIKGPADAWSKMEFRLIPLKRLDAVLKEATDNTYVVVMSCPGQHFATVTERCQGNRNVLKCWGAADDLSNNLDGLKVSVEEAVAGHGGAVASANLGGAAASARRASSIPSAPVASGKFMRFAMMSPGIPGGANVRRTTTVASEKIGCVKWDVFPSDTVEVTRVSQVGPDQWLKLAPSMLDRIDDGKKVAFDPHLEGWCVNYYDSDGWMFCPVSKYKMLSPGIPGGGARVRRTPTLRADHVGTVTWGAFRNDTIEVIEAKIVDGEEWLKLAPAMKRIIRADSDYRSFNEYTEGWCINIYDSDGWMFAKQE